jgi:hypothetical protein
LRTASIVSANPTSSTAPSLSATALHSSNKVVAIARSSGRRPSSRNGTSTMVDSAAPTRSQQAFSQVALTKSGVASTLRSLLAASSTKALPCWSSGTRTTPSRLTATSPGAVRSETEVTTRGTIVRRSPATLTTFASASTPEHATAMTAPAQPGAENHSSSPCTS